MPTQTLRQFSAPFIVIEGVDGSGKTTQAQMLAEWVRTLGSFVQVTREPGGTVLAERLRPLLLDPAVRCDARAELLLLLALRAQHVTEVIAPLIAHGTTVISDRFSLSSLAYQGYGRGLPLEEIQACNATATGGLQPALTVLLDVPFAVIHGRIGDRQDRFEGEGRDFLERVITGYRQLAASDPQISLIDGTGTVAEVQEAIRRVVRPYIADAQSAGGK